MALAVPLLRPPAAGAASRPAGQAPRGLLAVLLACAVTALLAVAALRAAPPAASPAPGRPAFLLAETGTSPGKLALYGSALDARGFRTVWLIVPGGRMEEVLSSALDRLRPGPAPVLLALGPGAARVSLGRADGRFAARAAVTADCAVAPGGDALLLVTAASGECPGGAPAGTEEWVVPRRVALSVGRTGAAMPTMGDEDVARGSRRTALGVADWLAEKAGLEE